MDVKKLALKMYTLIREGIDFSNEKLVEQYKNKLYYIHEEIDEVLTSK